MLESSLSSANLRTGGNEVRRAVIRRPVARRRAAGAGTLSDQLLTAATALITERGPQGFSLREVARRARVSEAAPYWHFASKEALLAAVAEQGFVGLSTAMAEVRARLKDPRRQL